MMLQVVHIAEGVRQASSLYCHWISVERPQGTELLAVWMDSEMRAFEEQPSATSEAPESGGALVPGAAEL